MSIIRFDLAQIRNLMAEVQRTSGDPALFLVRGRGIFMTAERCATVYAEGCDPNADPQWMDTTRSLAGMDEFHERISVEHLRQCLESAGDEHDAFTVRISPRDITMLAGYLSKPRDRYRARSSDGMGVSGLFVRLTASEVVSEADIRQVIARTLDISSPLRNTEIDREQACVVTGRVTIRICAEGEVCIEAKDAERGVRGPVEILPQGYDTNELAGARIRHEIIAGLRHIGLDVSVH